MYCSNCGREVPPQSAFCPYCQAALGAPAAMPPVQPMPPMQPMAPMPYGMPQPVRSSTLAMVSLVSGILGLTLCGGIGSIVALITGIMAKNEFKRDRTLTGEGQATAGVILGGIGVGLMVIGLIIWIVILAAAPRVSDIFQSIYNTVD